MGRYSNFAKEHALFDSDGNAKPSIELCYGPYPSLDKAWEDICSTLSIESEEDYKYIPIPLTVAIVDENDNATEMWMVGGHGKEFFVPKQASYQEVPEIPTNVITDDDVVSELGDDGEKIPNVSAVKSALEGKMNAFTPATINGQNITEGGNIEVGGSEVSVQQTLTSGTEIAKVSVDGSEVVLYAPSSTSVTVESVEGEKVKIATIGGVEVYAPNGTQMDSEAVKSAVSEYLAENPIHAVSAENVVTNEDGVSVQGFIDNIATDVYGEYSLANETLTFAKGGINTIDGTDIDNDKLATSNYVAIKEAVSIKISKTGSYDIMLMLRYRNDKIIPNGEVNVTDLLSVSVGDCDSIRFRAYKADGFTSVADISVNVEYQYKKEGLIDSNKEAFNQINLLKSALKYSDGETATDVTNESIVNGVVLGEVIWAVGSNKSLNAIPVKAGEKYEITANSSNVTRYAVVKSLGNGIHLESVDFASGFTGGIIINANGKVSGVVPSDGKYLIVNRTSNTDVYTAKSIIITKEQHGSEVLQSIVGIFDENGNISIGKVEEQRIDYLRSINLYSKAITIEEQEMIPSVGSCLTSFGGKLFFSINGEKFEVQMTKVN